MRIRPELEHLPARGWWLLVKAFLIVATIRLSLWVFPFPLVQRMAARLGRRSPRALEPLSATLVESRAWAVELVSGLVPRATCLTQALALQILLGRSGNPSQLRIGVALDEGRRLLAHAWLESEGQVLIGGQDLARYTRLAELGSITIGTSAT